MTKMTKDQAKWILKTMYDIRNFENQVHDIFTTGEIPGFVHLYAGEEAIATGVCANLTDDDYITSTHRGHGHCIAKGCDLDGMMAEIYGKETGLNKGKGGSMHIADVGKGMLGANGMVGGGFPIAVGAGLRNKYLKTKDVSLAMALRMKGRSMKELIWRRFGNYRSFLLTKITHLRKQHRNGIHPVLKQSPNVQQHMAFPV